MNIKVHYDKSNEISGACGEGFWMVTMLKLNIVLCNVWSSDLKLEHNIEVGGSLMQALENCQKAETVRFYKS